MLKHFGGKYCLHLQGGSFCFRWMQNNWEEEGAGLTLSQCELNSMMDVFKDYNQ
jgi:hypothetical protein